MSSQASKIIEKFGGARRLASLIGYRPSGVYRWMYPKGKGGTGGYIPTSAIDKVKKAVI